MNTDGRVKAFAFDLGNVLLDFEVSAALRLLAAHCGGNADDVMAALQKDNLARRLETGQISGRDFFEEFRRSANFRGNFEEFTVAWSDIFRENPVMISVMRTLKSRFPVYLLSNTNELHLNYIVGRFPFMREFDGCVYSFREKVMKPDPQIYRILLSRYGFDGDAVAFVDDRHENVEGAKSVGMKAVLLETPEQARNDLLKLAGM